MLARVSCRVAMLKLPPFCFGAIGVWYGLTCAVGYVLACPRLSFLLCFSCDLRSVIFEVCVLWWCKLLVVVLLGRAEIMKPIFV